MSEINVLANSSFIGVTGINAHFRNFYRELSKHCNLKVRNFTVSNGWKGLNDRPHEFEPYLNDIDRKMLYKQTLWTFGKRVDYPVYSFSEFTGSFDVNIVADVVNHYYFYDEYTGPKIAYTVWESDRLPVEFFDRLKYFDEIWTPSHWQKECMVKQGMDEKIIQVVPAGVEPDIFFPEEVPFDQYYSDGRFKFVIFGRWDYRKSTMEMIRTFLQTFQKGEPVDLVISVENPLPKDEFKTTEERLKHYGFVDTRIKVVHYASREDYIKFLKRGHVFLSCSRGEGWNLPLCESMACGTPSIYSNCSAQLEFTAGKGHPVNIAGRCPSNTGDDGEYCEPDWDHLSKVMRDVYTNYKNYKIKAVEDSKAIRKDFSWQRIGEIGGEKLHEFYNKKGSKKVNAEKAKLKVLYIAPHLSTGGMPQYLLKKIELMSDENDVYCVEYRQLATWYVVQRNKIVELLKDKFFSLQDRPPQDLLKIIDDIAPDVIHFEEFPETFVDKGVIKQIYKRDRKYLIFETHHSLLFDPSTKLVFPDKFLFVSDMQGEAYREWNVPFDVIEYPIKLHNPDKQLYRKELGFEDGYKHIINVGLFTPGKNQGELIQYAKLMAADKVKFHFIGNYAPNFESYWGPLLKNLPASCKIWGERDDVQKFYQAADLMVFTSLTETSPIVIREAISWMLPCLIHNLPEYTGLYEKYDSVKYLLKNNPAQNVKLIRSTLTSL